MVHRSTIVNESYSSHDKEKELSHLLPSRSWSSATVEVALRDRKFTYCRPHIINLLTTNDAFFHCLTLVDTCYQLGFSLAKKVR